MEINNKNLAEVLLKGNYVTEDDLKKFVSLSKSHAMSLKEYLIEEGLVSNDLIGQAVAEEYKLPYLDLKASPVSKEQVNLIPEEIAKKYRVVVFAKHENQMVFATDNPENKELLPILQKGFPNNKISIGYALPESIDELFINYQKSLATRFSKILSKNERVAPELLEEIFEDAIAFKASDIHFEPQIKNVIIRFRIDGVLHEAGVIPKEYYENILNRIKVKTGLRIDEHFSAQDGSLRYENNDVAVDMRGLVALT